MAHLIAHLKADPQAAELAAEVEVAAAALQARSEDWSRKRLAVVEMQAGLMNTTELVHDVVRAAHGVIRADVRYRRRTPKVLTYFPRDLAGIFRAPYTDQLNAVRTLAELYARDPSLKIREQARPVREAADQLRAAYEGQADAWVAEMTSYGQLQVEKLQSIAACRRAGHRLTELYPYERDRVRSYFRTIHRQPGAKARATEDDGPTTEVGSAAAGAPVEAMPALRLVSASFG